MLYLALKAGLSGILIAIVSQVAKRYPGFGALIASLPLVSVRRMIWLWRDRPDVANMAPHAEASFWFVLPSLPMFLLIPWMLRQGASFLGFSGSGLSPHDRAIPGHGICGTKAGAEAMTRLRFQRQALAHRPRILFLLAMLLFVVMPETFAFAQDISAADRAAVAQIEGLALFAFLYLGAKHMVTGIDQILFLSGVVFFLYRLRDAAIYVTMFTISHSLTRMSGVLLRLLWDDTTRTKLSCCNRERLWRESAALVCRAVPAGRVVPRVVVCGLGPLRCKCAAGPCGHPQARPAARPCSPPRPGTVAAGLRSSGSATLSKRA